MYYQVIPGKEEIFEAKFEHIADVLNRDPDHVESTLYHHVKQLNSYVILSEWKSSDAFTSFIHSEIFKQVTNWGMAEILERRPHHKIFRSPREEVEQTNRVT